MQKLKTNRFQLIPTLIVNIAALSSGLSIGFSAIALPQLRPFANSSADNPLYQPFTVDEESGSWVGKSTHSCVRQRGYLVGIIK